VNWPFVAANTIGRRDDGATVGDVLSRANPSRTVAAIDRTVHRIDVPSSTHVAI